MRDWQLGTIGFSYKEWAGAFYPSGMTQREYLPYYSNIFTSIEIDTTFHSIPRRIIVKSWNAATPLEFKFSFKTPRTITHELGLISAQGLMSEFLNSLDPLQGKTGPILIQLPPSYTQDKYPILKEFLESLPQAFRFAVEFRHSSWYNEKTTHLLSQYHVCWVSLDYPSIPRRIIPTTDFLYIRWIGQNGKYHYHSYERENKTDQLKWWIEAILQFSKTIPMIYGYFNNDYTGFAAGACIRFMQLAGLKENKPDTTHQERLF
jgi:uncharacterized protein YecE (DUF72 family)